MAYRAGSVERSMPALHASLGSFGDIAKSPVSWSSGANISEHQSVSAVEKKKYSPSVSAEAHAEDSALGLGSHRYYFPSSVLSKMPQALSDFDPELPATPELKPGSRMELRLRLSHVGEIDGLAILETDVPAALADAVLGAFMRMRFRPAEINGKPVSSESVVVIGFESDSGRRALAVAVDETSD